MPRATHSRGNVPVEVTSFVGRRSELAEIRTMLASAPLVSLVGPGGVGKTRLAVRAATDLARRFPDGVWIVELAEVRDPALVSAAVLAALDLRDQTATRPIALLRSYLREKRLLLVVDNCEHLLDDAARLVSEVITAAPGVRVIATSREPLGVAGEQVLTVPPLVLPPATREPRSPRSPRPEGRDPQQSEAVQLFVQRAAAATGQFALTADNQAAVAEVCQRLDGLPLAIELAAVRTRALSPAQIRDRLGDRFDLLTGGSRASLPRHQALRAAIDWSVDLLGPEERVLLQRLSVFPGRFTLEGVEAVCGTGAIRPGAVLALLTSLVEKSLVTKAETGDVAVYRLHESMREFARLKRQESGEGDDLDGRFVDHYAAQGHAFAAGARHALPQWLAWADAEIDSIRFVLRRSIDEGDRQRGHDLAANLSWFWFTRGTTEGVRWLDELLTEDDAPGLGPWGLFVRGFLAVLQNDPAAATPVLQRAVASAHASGDRAAQAQSLAMASIAATMAGDRESSRRQLTEASAIGRALDDAGVTLMVLQAESLNGLLDGDLAAVRSTAAEGARISRSAGDLYSLQMMLMNQAVAALGLGNLDEAAERASEGLRIAEQVDDRVALCYLLGVLACCVAGSRGSRTSARLLGAMENLRAEAGASINVGLVPALTAARATGSAALGPSAFQAECAAGEHLGRGAAVRLALGEEPSRAAEELGDRPRQILGKREVDVARLVAEGLSNKQVGARLFITDRTVESHVRSILMKLGFSSRAQIAAWISTSGLEEP